VADDRGEIGIIDPFGAKVSDIAVPALVGADF